MKARKPSEPASGPGVRRPASRREAEPTPTEEPEERCPTRTYPTRFRFPEPDRRREPIRYAR